MIGICYQTVGSQAGWQGTGSAITEPNLVFPNSGTAQDPNQTGSVLSQERLTLGVGHGDICSLHIAPKTQAHIQVSACHHLTSFGDHFYSFHTMQITSQSPGYVQPFKTANV